MDFIPYKINEILENKYYQIPQELFTNEKYKDKLNSDSKILYAFLLDRLTLSQKNHWYDDENRVYLIFTREEVQEKLNLSDKPVTKSFKQLSEVGLVYEKRQGLGKPNLIYVGKIQHEEFPESENVRFQNRKNSDSRNGENTIQDSENVRAINTNNINTNIIKTESINPKSDDDYNLMEIKNQCRLDEFVSSDKTLLENIIDTLYYKETLKVGNVIINQSKIRERLKLITKENLLQLLKINKNCKNIQNITNYLIICLYNNLGNAHINTGFCSTSASEEKSNNTHSWDDFYDNDYYDSAVAPS